MNTFFKCAIQSTFAIAVAAVCATTAQAGTISIGSVGVAAPGHTENFNVGALGNNVSKQFAANGITMTTLSGTGIVLASNASCDNSGSGVSGQYLYMGLSYPCTGSTAVDAVSIKFADTISELSWTGFSRAVGSGYTISALLNNVVVSSILFNASNAFENKTVLLSGSDFNELRFVENSTYSQFFALDNMAWNTAAVPEPGSVALLGLGLALLAAGRRRKA